jgi:hypothetical protein
MENDSGLWEEDGVVRAERKGVKDARCTGVAQ